MTRNTNRSQQWKSRLRPHCTSSAKPCTPFLISVWPSAIHTRAPQGTIAQPSRQQQSKPSVPPRGCSDAPRAKVDDHRMVYGAARSSSRIAIHRFHEDRRRQRLRRSGLLPSPASNNLRRQVQIKPEERLDDGRHRQPIRAVRTPEPRFAVALHSSTDAAFPAQKIPLPDPPSAPKHTLKNTLKSDRYLPTQGGPRRIETYSCVDGLCRKGSKPYCRTGYAICPRSCRSTQHLTCTLQVKNPVSSSP